ncbi:MAG: hypothetical protein M3Y91_02100 [Actinomycetota bacterium]|nr:hypothetical protein [Actinomycetota bacterium]
MDHRISAEERAAFRGCRRRWDLTSPNRMNLEPATRSGLVDLDRAVKDALAIHYFPGMWDWPPAIVAPLVVKGFDRSMGDQQDLVSSERSLTDSEAEQWHRGLDDGRRMLARYADWATSADRFAPVRVESDFEVQIPDPARPGGSLPTATAGAVLYVGRLDALVIDEFDAYWILRHRVVDRWTPRYQLELDEESIMACWAWESFYLGMTINGTIDNELRMDDDTYDGPIPPPGPGSPPGLSGAPAERRVRQSEGSGGGRNVPQHRRISAVAHEPTSAPRVEVDEGPGFRRTWIRRRSEEKAAAADRLAREAVAMIDPSVFTDPTPSDEQCRPCAYVPPCVALNQGQDPAALLADGYRRRPAEPELVERLGSVSWGFGRGAAPPLFGADRKST